MKLHRPELETTLIAMFAAVPLYFTGPIVVPATLFFHAVMAGIALGYATGRPIRLASGFMGLLAFSYLIFFPIDAVAISHSLIRASTHLLFFIAAYQAFEAAWKDNHGQRILVTFLIFVTSIATSTNISIIVFVLVFTVLSFRELMTLSWRRTMEVAEVSYVPERRNLQAVWYVVPTLLVAIVFFPLLPRLRNPFVQGPSTVLTNQATGITEEIDLSQGQYASDDPGAVARIWMGVDAIPFFTPIRLRAAVYDRYEDGRWVSSDGRTGKVWQEDDEWLLARPDGISTSLEIQQSPTADRQLFLPEGTYAVEDEVGDLYWGRGIDQIVTPGADRGSTTYEVEVAQRLVPFYPPEVLETGFPLTERIDALATEVAGAAQTPREKAAKVENWMTREFAYLPNSVDRDPMTLEEFLFEERRGHCEFFAAGMVVLLGSLDVPARIVGGFYGGELNPLGRYFVVRRSDAHAWVEVWDGSAWLTYDPTPPDLRPGANTRAAVLQYLSAIQDTVIYFWDRWVLTYGLSDQIEFFLAAFQQMRDVLGSIGASIRAGEMPRIPRALLIGVGMVVLAALAWNVARRRRRGLYEQLVDHLERIGHPIAHSSTAGELLASVRRERPSLVPMVAPVVRYHEMERFSGRTPSDEERRHAREALQRLRQAES